MNEITSVFNSVPLPSGVDFKTHFHYELSSDSKSKYSIVIDPHEDDIEQYIFDKIKPLTKIWKQSGVILTGYFVNTRRVQEPCGCCWCIGEVFKSKAFSLDFELFRSRPKTKFVKYDKICPVCTETGGKKLHKLKCGHYLHDKCRKGMQQHGLLKCPSCRVHI